MQYGRFPTLRFVEHPFAHSYARAASHRTVENLALEILAAFFVQIDEGRQFFRLFHLDRNVKGAAHSIDPV